MEGAGRIWWVAGTHGHREDHRRRRAPKSRLLFCSGLSVATVVTCSWYRRVRHPTRGIPAMDFQVSFGSLTPGPIDRLGDQMFNGMGRGGGSPVRRQGSQSLHMMEHPRRRVGRTAG